MAGTLVFLEHAEGSIVKGALGVLSRAAALDGEVAGVVLGPNASEIAPAAGAYGASTVHVCEDPALEAALPQPRVDALEALVERTGVENVLFAASVLAADVAAGLAARLGAGLNWDLTELSVADGELRGQRPALGDTVLVDVAWKGTPRVALVRSGAMEPAETGGTASVESFEATFRDHSTLASLVEHIQEEVTGPSIEDAQVIVAGGRGLGAAEGFRICEELADALGGAVAATRAVVDAGWYPYPTQVGQTGKTVAPRLYIACGISGAIQHKVGMQRSQTIVSVNKDSSAPIFEFSDFGVVGDVHKVIPKLTELVRERKA
jgi:electron transfer flavoprotein alpha subunit